MNYANIQLRAARHLDTYFEILEVVVRRCSLKLVFLKILQISQKTPVLESLFNKVVCFSTQVFSSEICEIFMNTFFYRTPPVDASKIIRV